MLSPNQIDALERRLAEIDKLRAENEARLAATPPHTATCRNYERQELESEASELLGERSRTARQIERAKTEHTKHFRYALPRKKTVDPELLRQKEVLDYSENEQRAVILREVNSLERQGDFRQARIWRAQLIGLRERIARELGFHLETA